jgi:hypothetical protein
MNNMHTKQAGLSILCAALVQSAVAAPVIYPAKGQNAAQTDGDKFACYDWSRQQSGFDPMQLQAAAPTQPATPAQPQAATTGGNGVSGMVKGAAGGAAVAELTHGDTGKGAAVGVLGAGLRERMKQQQQMQQHQQQQPSQQAQQQQQLQQQQQAARAQQRAAFERGFAACMEGRGYVVK